MKNASTTHRNIKTISDIEQAAIDQRSWSTRIGDVITTEAGKMWFIIFHLIWFTIWISVNLRAQNGPIFDPFPFSLLTMIVSLESIFLSIFLLMSQNHSGLLADRRNHLDLQINLLAEDENTKILQMLQALCEHHKLPIGKDPEIIAMAKRTDLEEVLEDLIKHLPG